MNLPRAFLALDFESADEARRALQPLVSSRAGVKVGLELFTAAGPSLVKSLAGDGWPVFLDLKLHDIPRTMERAAAAAAALGVDLLTVHASAGTEGVAAAVRGVHGTKTRILAVTVLTSAGGKVQDRVRALAQEAVGAGAHGLVLSVLEARAAREAFGPGVFLVTPGIRFALGEAHDQKRVSTPEVAAREGADAMVLGRAVFGAEGPLEALGRALREFAFGLTAVS